MLQQKELQVQNLRAKKSMALLGTMLPVLQEWILKRKSGVEVESRGQAIKGLRCHTAELEPFFSLGQWGAVEEL